MAKTCYWLRFLKIKETNTVMGNCKIFFIVIALILCLKSNKTVSQSIATHRGEYYFSWGYNTEWYTHSNVKVTQPTLNNKYTFSNIVGHDHRGWDEGLFSKPLTIPQYNYRLGYFFNDKKNLGIEINFDHTKFIMTDGQNARVKGTLNGRNVDTSVVFSGQNGFYYYLNNGANFLLFNLIKRWSFSTNKKRTIKLDALGKAGLGPVIPHVDNSFFGNKNNAHFQFGGWNTGIEGDIRATFYKHVYLEFAGKLDYARYSNLRIYEGTAKHSFGTAELVLNLGYTIKGKAHKYKH